VSHSAREVQNRSRHKAYRNAKVAIATSCIPPVPFQKQGHAIKAYGFGSDRTWQFCQGCWLIAKGRHHLALMQRHEWDDVEGVGLPHDSDRCEMVKCRTGSCRKGPRGLQPSGDPASHAARRMTMHADQPRLSDARKVSAKQQARAIKIGVASSVRSSQCNAAEISPSSAALPRSSGSPARKQNCSSRSPSDIDPRQRPG
jgi:hypothetical protein